MSSQNRPLSAHNFLKKFLIFRLTAALKAVPPTILYLSKTVSQGTGSQGYF